MIDPEKISIDSRTVKRGELFIPIKGKNFDGRVFIKEALKKGAKVLEVKNGIKALQDIAACNRSRYDIPVVGVTGSAGKTTTKDMIAAILSQELLTLKNEENKNNEIGVPLTLLKLKKKHQAAVIEMAMQKLGEIAELAKIVRPTIAVVTNIGEAHLKYLKTRKNIARTKAEIFNFLKSNDYAVLNRDDPYYGFLRKRLATRDSRPVTFGIRKEADITPKDLKGIKLPLPGEHNIYNALAAIAVAKILKIKKASIKKGLESFRPSRNRMDIIPGKNGIMIINDTYNANPTSMKAALKTLAQLKGGRKIAVLGDMLELGKAAKKYHRQIGRFARRLRVDMLITVGKLSKAMQGGLHYKNALLAAKELKTIIKPHDIILLKGSRGIGLDAAVVELAYTYV